MPFCWGTKSPLRLLGELYVWVSAFTLFLDRKRFERGFHVERLIRRDVGGALHALPAPLI